MQQKIAEALLARAEREGLTRQFTLILQTEGEVRSVYIVSADSLTGLREGASKIGVEFTKINEDSIKKGEKYAIVMIGDKTFDFMKKLD